MAELYDDVFGADITAEPQEAALAAPDATTEDFEVEIDKDLDNLQLPGPSLLDTLTNAVVKFYSSRTKPIDCYAFEDIETAETILLEHTRGYNGIKGKNVFGECIFESTSDEAKGGRLTVSVNDRVIGYVHNDDTMDSKTGMKMKAKMTAYEVDDTMTEYYSINNITVNKTESQPEEGPDPAAGGDDGEAPAVEFEGDQLAYISWNGADCLLGMVDEETPAISKILILVQAVLVAKKKFNRLNHLTRYGYEAPRLLPGTPMAALVKLTQLRIEKKHIDDNNICYYTAYDSSIKKTNRILVFECDCYADQFRAKTNNGVTQFIFYGVKHVNSSLIVNTHARHTFGFQKNGIFTDAVAGLAVMQVRYQNQDKNIPFEISRMNATKKIASFAEGENAQSFDITISKNLPTNFKAMILAYAMKEAVLNIEGFKPNVDDPHVEYFYDLFPNNSSTTPSSLIVLDGLADVTISKAGQCSNAATYYYELHNTADNDKVHLVFEATHKLENVEALARNVYGKPQFSMFGGLYRRKKELTVYLNSGDMIGLWRRDTCFDHNSKTIMVAQHFPDLGCDGDEGDEEDPSMIYHIIDTRNKEKRTRVAVISGDCSEVAVSFTGCMNVSMKALVLSFAMKLSYVEYKIHTESTPNLKYQYLGACD